VLEAPRLDHSVGELMSSQGGLDGRQQLQRAASGGVRVDQQQVISSRSDPVNLVAAGEEVGAGSRLGALNRFEPGAAKSTP
jgi:hypothetical protein